MGVPGSAGQFARIRLGNGSQNSSDDQVIWVAGGNGGASGAGLILIVRGLVINGAINLDGGDGSDALPDTQFTQTPLRGGGGAAGSGGACYVFFDGIGIATATGGFKITSRRGSPGVGSGSGPGLPPAEQNLAHVRFQSIPPSETPLPDAEEIPDFTASVSTTLAIVGVTNGLVDQATYAANPVIAGARTLNGVDISNQVTYAIGSVTGSATVTVDGVSGLISVTQLGPEGATVRIDVSLGGQVRSVNVTFVARPTVVPIWRYVMTTGQSNAIGTTSIPVLSTSVPNNLDAVRVNNGNNALEPLVAIGAEDPTNGLGYTLSALTGERAIVNTTGISGATYDQIKPGASPETFSHQNLLDDYAAVLRARSIQQVRPFLAVFHGETDQDNGVTNYAALLREWVDETAIDLQLPLAMFVQQVSSTGSFTGGRLKLTLPQQQLAAHVANPDIHLVGPGYPGTYNDQIHFNNESKPTQRRADG